MKKLLTFLIIILFLQPASAYIYLNIYIEENGEAIFLGETSESLNFPNGVNLENGIIMGSTQELTSKQGSIWTFSYSLEGADINVIFPESATLISISNGEISIDNNKISVYTKSPIEATYTIGTTNKFPYILFIVILILLILLIIFYYLRRKKKKIKETNKLEILKQVLSDRERLILDALKKSGKTKSSYLRKLTELPKASFSRHIQELEKKKLIKRSGEGRNKFIEIIVK